MQSIANKVKKGQVMFPAGEAEHVSEPPRCRAFTDIIRFPQEVFFKSLLFFVYFEQVLFKIVACAWSSIVQFAE